MAASPRLQRSLRQVKRANMFKLNWQRLRDELNCHVRLSANISAEMFPRSVELGDEITEAVRKARRRNADISRCNEFHFTSEVSKVFARLGEHAMINLSHSSNVGAFEVSTTMLQLRLKQLLEFDGDTIFGCSEDRKWLFSFDFDPDYGTGLEYEVLVAPWGDH
jgi:hypothetical protein